MRGLQSQLRRILASLAMVAIGIGCATSRLDAVGAGPAYQYFRNPSLADPWTPKIAAWQSREQALPETHELEAPASVSGSGHLRSPSNPDGDLRRKYFLLRKAQKRQMATDLAEWIQTEAKSHYVADGPIDHWATLEETLAKNGDDCDGLELLVYHFLRDLGFREDEVFRAIVYRPRDGQHHMVTLWFETPADPWVIDPTGAMTSGMPRMSQMSEWVPLKLFSETEEFTVNRTVTSAR